MRDSSTAQYSRAKHHGYGWLSWDTLSLIPLLLSLHPRAANWAWNVVEGADPSYTHTQRWDRGMMSFIYFPAMFPCGVSAPLSAQKNTFLSVTLPHSLPLSLFFYTSHWKVCFSTTATETMWSKENMERSAHYLLYSCEVFL